MDSAEKLLGALKGLPLSILAALTAVAIIVLADAPLQAGLPIALKTSFPLLTLCLVALTVCSGVAHWVSRVQTARQLRAAEDSQRLEKIYGPLLVIFARTHVTVCTGVLAPRLRHRLANARKELVHYRRPLTGMRRAFKALGDRRASTSAEVEYGGEFPLAEIHKLIAANPAVADSELINFARRADRSRYEDCPGSGLLTDDDLALFEYIQSEHARLSRRPRW